MLSYIHSPMNLHCVTIYKLWVLKIVHSVSYRQKLWPEVPHLLYSSWKWMASTVTCEKIKYSKGDSDFYHSNHIHCCYSLVCDIIEFDVYSAFWQCHTDLLINFGVRWCTDKVVLFTYKDETVFLWCPFLDGSTFWVCQIVLSDWRY